MNAKYIFLKQKKPSILTKNFLQLKEFLLVALLPIYFLEFTNIRVFFLLQRVKYMLI